MPGSERLADLAISPSGFCFDPRTGAGFTVNATGRRLLEGLRDGLGLSDLRAMLTDEFDVDGVDLERDVLEYVRLVREQGLVPTDFELSP